VEKEKEKEKGKEEEKEESEDQWLEELAMRAHMQIAIVELPYNLVSRRPLVKHLVETITYTMQNSSKVLTPEVIGHSIPFAYPDSLPADLAALSPPVKGAYRKYGKVGSTIVLLDYHYGENRYLPLLFDRANTCLPPNVGIDNLADVRPAVGTDNLHIIDTRRHIAFLALYLHPEEFAEQEVQLRATIYYKPPKKDAPEHVKIKKALSTAWKFWSDVIDVSNRSKRITVSGTRATGMFHAVYLSMLMDQMRTTILEDMSANAELYGAESKTLQLLREGEISLLGLPQK